MANEAAGGEQTDNVGRVKLPLASLLLVVIFGVWLGLAGGGAAVFYLVKSGRLPVAHVLAAVTGAAAGRTIVLEPILVNLADAGGHAYLRIGITLEVTEEAPVAVAEAGAAKEKIGSEGAVRDIVLTILSRQSSAFLLGPDGKEHLKIELKDAVSKSNLKLIVNELYFSDFLVQS